MEWLYARFCGSVWRCGVCDAARSPTGFWTQRAIARQCRTQSRQN